MSEQLDIWWVAYLAVLVSGTAPDQCYEMADNALDDYITKRAALERGHRDDV